MPGITSAQNGALGGRPPGRKNDATIARELRLERIKERVDEATDVLVNSQIALGRGLSFLYRIDKDAKGKDKKPELVTSQSEIEDYLAGNIDEDSYYYITTERPDNQAINALFDRTHGKASQSVDIKIGQQPTDFTEEELLIAEQAIANRLKNTSNKPTESSGGEIVSQ
jgi:hypothetical protein